MPDDLRPSELGEVGAAVAVAEYPPVALGRVELAVVAVHDPAPRFVRVAVPGPPVGQFPHVVIERRKHLTRDFGPVIGGPPPNDWGELFQYRRHVRATQGTHLGAEP